MQSVSSTIWTRVAMSISYDDNHYTTGTSAVTFYSFFLLVLAPFIIARFVWLFCLMAYKSLGVI